MTPTRCEVCDRVMTAAEFEDRHDTPDGPVHADECEICNPRDEGTNPVTGPTLEELAQLAAAVKAAEPWGLTTTVHEWFCAPDESGEYVDWEIAEADPLNEDCPWCEPHLAGTNDVDVIPYLEFMVALVNAYPRLVAVAQAIEQSFNLGDTDAAIVLRHIARRESDEEVANFLLSLATDIDDLAAALGGVSGTPKEDATNE